MTQNPVDYWNMNGSWEKTFTGIKGIEVYDEANISVTTKGSKLRTTTIIGHLIEFPENNQHGIPPFKQFTRFECLTHFQFKDNPRAAASHIEYTLLNHDIPYIRVGTDYFKIITKRDRYGVDRSIIKGWRKEEIKQDHGANILRQIHLFDDFCIEPDNSNYQLTHNNCYNVYAPFSHTPFDGNVLESQIPISMRLMGHIFGNQLELGLKYMKVLFEMPRQKLPVLCLVSQERQTGKTTFITWLSMIFGDNYGLINPEDLSSNFNSTYASKNIIAIDETVLDKAHAIEKLKSIATAPSMSVNQKFVANYSLPFFGKVIICTNKEKDFMKIDEEEIRFWIRKINTIKDINTNIENELRDEIPKFLRFLQQEPKVDTSKSRMVFTADELTNEHLNIIKEESYSGLRKEIIHLMSDFFTANDGMEECYASSTDIKSRWFDRQQNISHHYISKVIQDEMGYKLSRVIKYSPFDFDPTIKRPGRVFLFKKSQFL